MEPTLCSGRPGLTSICASAYRGLTRKTIAEKSGQHARARLQKAELEQHVCGGPSEARARRRGPHRFVERAREPERAEPFDLVRRDLQLHHGMIEALRALEAH